MRHLVVACLLAVTVGCTSGAPQPAAVASPSPIAASCAATSISRGEAPAWLDQASGHNSPVGVPFAIDGAQTVVGFLFGNPLRAGHPENPANKILWIVRFPRDGSDLTINAHPEGSATPVVKVVQPANSGPGEIYPSIVDMPTAGCWVMDLAWGSHRATLALPYA
jgi:hypothetical protein